MELDFHLTGFGEFDVVPALPPGYRGAVLAGGEVLTATGDRGQVVLQTITHAAFEIRFYVLNFIHPFRFTAQQPPAPLVSFLTLKNRLQWAFQGLPTLQLKQGQFALLHTPGKDIVANYDHPTEYQHLEISWSKTLLEKAAPFFGILSPLLQQPPLKRSFWLGGTGKDGNYQSLQLARDILKAPYQTDLNQLYFEYKVMEYLICLLDQSTKAPRPKWTMTADEEDRIRQVGFTVSLAPEQRFPISVLAQQAHMNEMKLKMGFRKIHGQGIFEYQLAARMHEALRLLRETDLPTEAIAARVGYQLTTSFITKFREFHGFAPGTVTRSKR